MAAHDVFVDTSALYALVNRNDAAHEAAKAEVSRLVASRRLLVVTDYVVAEAVNLANVRGGPRVSLRILDLIEQSKGFRVEWIGSERFAGAATYFRKHSDQRYSFTDCTSFVVMKELKLTEALTTDHHFRRAGFQPLLPAGD